MLAHARRARRPRAGGGETSDSTVSVWSQVRSCREIYTNVLWAGGEPGRRPPPGRRRRPRGVVPSAGSGGGSGGGCDGAGDVDSSGEGSDFSSGRCGGGGVGVDGCSSSCETQAGGDRERARSLQRERRLLPPPLWPACGVRSLTVWQRAWASRGLQVSFLAGTASMLWTCRSSRVHVRRLKRVRPCGVSRFARDLHTTVPRTPVRNFVRGSTLNATLPVDFPTARASA